MRGCPLPHLPVQLAATAAQFLRMQLELFGSMESAGGFHAVGRSRWGSPLMH